jgi:colanic acid biosynthesis protein WcaH
MLSHDDYIKAIELTQLVSIDLVISDQHGNVLVGKRKNEPAKDTWFVPGSRLYKMSDGKMLLEEFHVTK